MRDPIQLSIRTVARASLMGDEDDLGRELVQLVQRALGEGVQSAAAVRVKDTSIDIMDLGPALRAGIPMRQFLASLTRVAADPVEAVGIIGRVGRTVGAPGTHVPVAVVFLEWEDNRWWHYEALLEGDSVREDAARWCCALEGDPMPARLGRWWSLGRRNGVQARLDRTQSAETSDMPMVH